MKTSIAAVAWSLMLAGLILAQEPGGAAPDLAKGAVDPLDAGGQRARFLRAAGVDTELSRDEFDADAKNADGFVRSFDRWDSLSRFDRNQNGTIDWFEATGYRDDLRARFLATYDADRNGRLTGDERVKANEALASGRLPAALAPPQDRAGVPGAPGLPGEPGRGGGPGGFQDNPEFQRIRQQLLEKYDKDGDGELNREERTASRQEAERLFREAFTRQFDTNGDGQIDENERAQVAERFRAQREQWFERRFDRNNDGQLDDAERAEMERARQEFRQRGEEGRRRFIQEFDKDGDGQLSEDEQQAVRETFRQRFEERRREAIERFDADGDGQLNEQEQRTARETQRREFMERFDADGDGQLSEEEQRKVREEFGREGFGGFGGFGDGFRDRGDGDRDRDRRRSFQ